MKRELASVIILISCLFLVGAIDTFEGQSVDTSSTIEGTSSISKVEGQEVVGGSSYFIQENFESDYADSNEWSLYHSWVEIDSTVDVFVADSDTGQPDCTYCTTGGSFVGMMVGQGSNANRRIMKSFTAITSGYVTFEFDFKITAAPSSDTIVFNVQKADGTDVITFAGDSSNNLRFYENGGWTDTGKNFTNATWHHAEIQLDVDDSDGTDCVTFWLDNAQGAISHDTQSHVDPENIARAGNNLYFSNSGNTSFIDNIVGYAGTRQ